MRSAKPTPDTAPDQRPDPLVAEYVEAPTEYDGHRPAVFLAGGITGCPDWQAEARRLLGDLPVAILNPRRADFPIHDPSAAQAQIDWEFRHLRRADVVLFWFPDSGPVVQPIALYELGAHAASGKSIAVGADARYLRRADVLLQLGHVRPDVVVRNDLDAVCADARALLATPGPDPLVSALTAADAPGCPDVPTTPPDAATALSDGRTGPSWSTADVEEAAAALYRAEWRSADDADWPDLPARDQDSYRAVMAKVLDALAHRCVHGSWTCDHCHDDPPPGHTCPACGRLSDSATAR